MKYFVVADVHGFYDEMKAALDAAGFDANNENHTLVSLGDAIDRGKRPNEVIKYFVNLPRKILIRGNHEDLLDILMSSSEGPYSHDLSNGTYNTLIELASKYHKINYGTSIGKQMARYMDWFDLRMYAKRETTYRQYKELLVDYFETPKYVFVHGWIPTLKKTSIDRGKICYYYEYYKDWRKGTAGDWNDARWSSGIDCTVQQIFEPGKTIVCGHWHASAWHEVFEGKKEWEDNSPFFSENVIACDTCTALSKKVNVVVLEDEENYS